MAAHGTRPLPDATIHEQDLRGALAQPGSAQTLAMRPRVRDWLQAARLAPDLALRGAVVAAGGRFLALGRLRARATPAPGNNRAPARADRRCWLPVLRTSCGAGRSARDVEPHRRAHCPLGSAARPGDLSESGTASSPARRWPVTVRTGMPTRAGGA
jgi:hypothetical protein